MKTAMFQVKPFEAEIVSKVEVDGWIYVASTKKTNGLSHTEGRVKAFEGWKTGMKGIYTFKPGNCTFTPHKGEGDKEVVATVTSKARLTSFGYEVQTSEGPVCGVDNVKIGDKILAKYRSTRSYGLWFFVRKVK